MAKPIKILVLNDDSFPAMTVYDPVLQHGFKMLNRPLTKESYQSHPSYNELLNESAELSKRFFFEPSDLFAPLVKIDATDEGDIPQHSPRLEGLDKWLTTAGMRRLLEQSDILGAELSGEDLELRSMLQALNQGEPNLRPLGNGLEWLHTHVDADASDMPESTRKADLHLVEDADTAQVEPLQQEELACLEHTVFFTLDDYTNVDTKFIAQHFDGIFLVCHAPLGSKVLPESLMSILTERGELGLWLFNLQVDTKAMHNALSLKHGEFNLQLMQSMQTTELQQVQVFLDRLIPQAAYVGCLSLSVYEALSAYYTYSQDPSAPAPHLQLSHNVYQSLHYLNQVKSLCNTGFGLASLWQQGGALSAKAKLHGISEGSERSKRVLNPLQPAFTSKVHAGKTNALQGVQEEQSSCLRTKVKRVNLTGHSERVERQAKVKAALALEEAMFKGCSVAQFPKQLFGCPFNKLSDWKTNTLPPEQNVDNYVPHLLISSKYFNYNPLLGMELMGARLLVQILASCSELNLSLVFNQCVYSWLADMPKDTILWQEQGELTSRDAFIESAKATHDLMSSAMRTRVMNDLRRHILATLNDQDAWPWTVEQRHNLESWVVKFDSPSAGKIFCYPRLTEAVLNLSPDVVISDIHSDLVRARSRGLAAIELVESPSQWDGLAQFTHDKSYFENLAANSDIEQGAILRFSLDRIFNAQKSKTLMCAKQASSAVRNKLLLRGLAQQILWNNKQEQGSNLQLSQSALYKNTKLLPSNYGFSSGYKLAWTDVLHKLDWINYVFAEESLSEQINTCYQEHISLLRHLVSSLRPVLDAKQQVEQSIAPQFKRAQLSNFTCAKRYAIQHLGLSYLAALAHAQGFGDGATLISKVAQFEPSQVWHDQLLKLAQQGQDKAGATTTTTSSSSSNSFQTALQRQSEDSTALPPKAGLQTMDDRSQLQVNLQVERSDAAAWPSQHLSPERYSEQVYQAAVNAVGKQQVSKLTQAFIQQGAHWPIFKPLSLSVLSFGCSRGDEIFDLLPLFNGQCLTGIDINEGAIQLAQQQLMNLPEVPLEQAKEAFSKLYALPEQILTESAAQLHSSLDKVEHKLAATYQEFAYTQIKEETANCQTSKTSHKRACQTGMTSKTSAVHGASNRGELSFTTTTTTTTTQTAQGSPSYLDKLLHVACTGAGDGSALRPRLVQYLGAMGLINFASSQDFFAQYAGQPLPQFDVVTAMTVLCRHPETMFLLNANEVYPFSEFMDTLNLLDQMVKPGGLLCLFNSNYLLEDSPLASKYVGVYPFKLETQGAQDIESVERSLASSLAAVAQSCFTEQASLNQHEDSDACANNKPSYAICQGVSLAKSIPLPRHYAELYRERGLFDKGHVALFNPDGSLCTQRREEAMIIYYKKPE